MLTFVLSKLALWSNGLDGVPQGSLWWFESARCLQTSPWIELLLELFRSKLLFHEIFLLLRSNWHRGRVARRSSAKACTAVRIRSMPQRPNVSLGFFLAYFFNFLLKVKGFRGKEALPDQDQATDDQDKAKALGDQYDA